jgi:carboxylesterase
MPTPTATDLFAAAYRDPIHEPFTLPGTSGGALLVHGFPGTPADMRPLAAALNSAGWAVRAPLLPGFGKDIATLPGRKMEDWAAAVREELRDLQGQHRRTLLVGHSMGGALALKIAAELQPDQLILLAPFWKINHPLWRLLPVLRIIFPSFKPFSLMKVDFDDPAARKGIGGFMPEADMSDPVVQDAVRNFAIPTGMLNQVRRAGLAGKHAVPRIKSSTLVLQGTKDDLVTPENTKRLMAALPTLPQVVEVEAGHALVEADKSAWPQVKHEVLAFAAAHL